MAKKQAPISNKPMVSSVTAQIRNTTYSGSNTVVATPEETVNRKKGFLKVLDKAMNQIKNNIESGTMKFDSTLDLDRVIKLSLLVSGEADSITAKSGKETEQQSSIETQKLSMSKIEQILDLNDPEVKAMYDKLYDSYNSMNDEVED